MRMSIRSSSVEGKNWLVSAVTCALGTALKTANVEVPLHAAVRQQVAKQGLAEEKAISTGPEEKSRESIEKNAEV